MPRTARTTTAEGSYHIMMRGNNHQDIFLDMADRFRFLDCLERNLKNPLSTNGKEVGSYEVYAYALMSNHFHILVRVVEGNIGDFVKRLASSYVVYFNKKYHRDGHLFRGRFKSEVCEDEEYFKTLLRYIHQNPIKAGLCTNLMKYQFTSWPEYMGHEKYPYRICSVGHVLDRLPLKELEAMVYDLLPDNLRCLSVDNPRCQVTENSMAQMLKDIYNIDNPQTIKNQKRSVRTDIIKSLLELGATISQIHKLTGISKSTIFDVSKKMAQ